MILAEAAFDSWKPKAIKIMVISTYDGHVLYLWCKSIRGVVADEPHSDSQVSSGDAWERGSDSEIVA